MSIPPPLQQAYDRAAAQWDALRHGGELVFYVGAATCGRAAGAGAVLDRLRAEIDARGLAARVVEVGCIGPCSLEPLVIVQKPGAPRICYGQVDAKKIVEILERWALGSEPCAEWALGTLNGAPNGATHGKTVQGVGRFWEHPIMSRQVRRILRNCGLIDPENVDHYLARDGYRGFLKALELGSDGVFEQVKASGLRGRGGAGFPAWRKWAFCREAPGRPKYLICNADEGDPGAFMNRSLLESDPHTVLEGMLIAALALGASKGYIYCRMEYPLAIRRLEIAIEQMKALGLLGRDILGSGFDFELKIKRGAGAFVCGEETALIASIEGRRGMPAPRPPFPAIQGLWGKPTIIQNVESLGNLPLIMIHGAEWWSGVGSASSKGTKTFSLAGKVRNCGLIEVPLGITLNEVVNEIGGGTVGGRKLKAVQTGGPSGGCIPAERMDLPIDYESLQSAGSIMGSGGMIVLDENTCVVDLAKYFLTFTQAESCGKCPPCRVGTGAMLLLLERIAAGLGTMEDLNKLERLAEIVRDGSLCGLGQTAPNPVLTTLRYFRDEYVAHIERRECPAFVCSHLIEYHIDAERCTGCRACSAVCPSDAILGEKGDPQRIDGERCIHCGACLSICPTAYAAVYRISGAMTRIELQREKKSNGSGHSGANGKAGGKAGENGSESI
jgi:NADH:ubiquinone oxidoreductase subunit F (NADH-binding)/NAD-dependent dihydropyrimidine dehydrogenase PreA subunit/(2Fe-2S) ferredoxin